MEGKNLPDWEAFERELHELRAKIGHTLSRLLFRGLNDHELPLTTTLERAGCEGMSFDDYYSLAVSRIRPAVETFTGAIWDVPEYGMEIRESFHDPESAGGPDIFCPSHLTAHTEWRIPLL